MIHKPNRTQTEFSSLVYVWISIISARLKSKTLLIQILLQGIFLSIFFRMQSRWWTSWGQGLGLKWAGHQNGKRCRSNSTRYLMELKNLWGNEKGGKVRNKAERYSNNGLASKDVSYLI